MEMKVYLREAEDTSAEWVDISERCVRPSIRLTEGFSTAGKTGDATELTLTIKALNVTDAAAFHTTEKLVRLSIDGIVVFEGYSNGQATVDLGTSTSFVHVRVTFSSYMALLKEQTAPTGGIVYEGKKIFDPSDKANSLVHLLVDDMYDLVPAPYHDILAAITDRVVSEATATAITKTLPIVYIEEDATVYDVFQSLLYENGLSFYYRNRAIYVLQPWDTERTATDCLLTDFISKPTLKQQPLRHRSHLSLNLAEYTVESNATLYDSGDPDSDEGNPQVIEPGESYPEDGEPEALDYENPDDEEAEIVYSKSAALSYSCVKVDDSASDYDDWGTDPAPVTVSSDIRPTEGTVLFSNPNTYRIGIQRYQVTAATAYWKKYTTRIKDSIKEGEEEEYDADYLPDTESAEAFISLYHLQEWANNAEIILTTERLQFLPGNYVQVSDLPYKLLVLSRQTSYDNPERPLYKYSMIPLVLIESPTDITHSKPGSGGNVLRYLFLELTSVYFHYDSEGKLAPSDQVIYANLTRVNIASTPVWTINGKVVDSVEGNPDRLRIDPSYMEGRTTIPVTVTCGRYTKSLTITKVQDGAGGQPVQFWQWGEEFDRKPDDSYEVLAWGDLAITLNGWAFVTNPGQWATEIPPRPDDKPYLWCKFWNYNTNDWDYYCMTGTPAIDFNLVISPTTYNLTSRGYTKGEQKIRVVCNRINTNGDIAWQISNNLKYEITEGALGNYDITITIPALIELPNFEVTCSIEKIGLTKSYVVAGVPEGKEEEIYMGVYPSIDAIPDMTTEGPVIYGDHALVEDSDGNRTPYYWSGTQWVMADGQTPTTLAWKILQNCLYDATTAPGTVASQSVINLFAQNFAAYNAFLYNLKVRNLLIGDGTDGSGFQFIISDYQNGGDTVPIVKAIYDGKVVFQIDPTTGNVFFGEPNDDLSAPAKGFMYRASDQAIVSVSERFKVNANGKLSASQATISGSITATSGTFYGDIDCPIFSTNGITPESSATAQLVNSAASSISSLESAVGIGSGTYYCSLSTNSAVRRVRMVYTPTSVDTDGHITSFIKKDISFLSSSGSTLFSLRYYAEMSSSGTYVLQSDWFEGNYTTTNHIIPDSELADYGIPGTLTITTGGGKIFNFSKIPYSPAGLKVGDVYADSGTLKIVVSQS